jgi:hypothetical protein
MVVDAIGLACRTLRERGRGLNDLCDALGVPRARRDAVRAHGCVGALLGILPIQVHGNLFDIAEGKRFAAILAAYQDPDELPVDLVAIRLDEPRKAYRHLGIADALGEQAIACARYESVPSPKTAVLTVYPTALDWLRSGGDGCAILDDRRTPTVLADIDECVASPSYAPKLHKLLQQHPAHLPRVMVREREGIAT